jgi:hypothetical protein
VPVSVHGVAYDSVRAAPLRNAFIAIVGTALSAHADERGRFRIDSVSPGTYIFAVQHDALDSLGFAELATRAAVADGRDEVRISVPSFATLWRAGCGPHPPPNDSGFVYGIVRDASTRIPVANAFVDLSWIDLRIDKQRGVTQRQLRFATRAGADGRFTVCGVPVTHWLRIGAGVTSGASGVIDLPPSELRVRRRDLLIGATGTHSRSVGTITGLLTDASGEPFANVRVVVDDSSEVRSDADGSFTVRNVPAGTRQVEILSIGTRAVVTAVDVLPNDTATLALQLRRVTTLDVVRVTASRRGRILVEEIEARRTSGHGYLVDAAEIATRGTLSSVFSDLPSARVETRSGNFTVHVPDGRGGMCAPDLWIDGVVSAYPALSMMHPREVAAVELFPRAGVVPTRYRRDLSGKPSCGSILVWTNWGLGRS